MARAKLPGVRPALEMRARRLWAGDDVGQLRRAVAGPPLPVIYRLGHRRPRLKTRLMNNVTLRQSTSSAIPLAVAARVCAVPLSAQTRPKDANPPPSGRVGRPVCLVLQLVQSGATLRRGREALRASRRPPQCTLCEDRPAPIAMGGNVFLRGFRIPGDRTRIAVGSG